MKLEHWLTCDGDGGLYLKGAVIVLFASLVLFSHMRKGN